MFVYYKCYIMTELTFLKQLMLIKQKNASKVCDIYCYWYFLNYSFKLKPNVCNRCHDLLMISANLRDIAILNIKDSDYRCIISLISKKEAINLIQNADLTENTETLQKINSLFSFIRMGKEVLTFGNIEIEKNGRY